MTAENQFAVVPELNPGNSITFLNGTSGTVTATWLGTVVYESLNGESTLRGDEIDRFVEIEQGKWLQQTEWQIRELEQERTYHLKEFRKRLENNFLLAEKYLNAPDLLPQVRRYLISEKIQYIRAWVSTFSARLPDREQSEAIGTISGNVLVTARAGSGKTATLVNRAIFLIRQCHIAPEKILLLAFNKKAALEVRRRILEVIDPEANDRVTKALRSKQAKSSRHRSNLDPVDLEATVLDDILSQSALRLPHAMTFHALAYRIVHPEEEILFDRKESSESQSQAVQQIIDSWLTDPKRHSQIRGVMLDHFRQDWDYIVNQGYNRDRDSFLQYRRSIVSRTFNGEYVKSYGEKLIADFLFENDVAYRYERNFRWNQINYKPDFTIFPKLKGSSQDRNFEQVIIEYFGLAGDPDYDEKSAKKRQFWEGRDATAFLEYSPVDIASLGLDGFRDKMRQDLHELGVQCVPLSEDEIWERARDRLLDGFTKAVKGFVSRCRKLALTVDHLDALLANDRSMYQTEVKFYEVASGIYTNYLERLDATGEEDFDGLILRAVEAIKCGQTAFYSKSDSGDLAIVEHISVDEYQDFSELFFRLLQAIRQIKPDLQLFCVGDDWQAINAFAGSDLRFFREFKSYFPNSSRLSITANYRSDSLIVEVGNSLMYGFGNPSQAHSDNVGRVELADLAEFSPSRSEESRFQGDEITPAMLRLVHDSVANGKKIAILARRNGLPYYFVNHSRSHPATLLAFEESLKSALSTRDHHKLEVSTTHSFKGLERSKVIVIDAVDRGYPLIHPNWIFSRIFGDTLDEVVAAERRLFYVALTRAVHDLVIVTDSKRPSEFLTDLSKRIPIDALDWNYYRPAPARNNELHIRLKSSSKSGGTYPIKDQIKACGYRWYSGTDSCWRKSVSTARFSLDQLRNEPWVSAAVNICVLIDTDDDETIAWYELDQGRWKVRKDDLDQMTGES